MQVKTQSVRKSNRNKNYSPVVTPLKTPSINYMGIMRGDEYDDELVREEGEVYGSESDDIDRDHSYAGEY